MIDIYHQPCHGLGLHVSISSHHTGQSDQYPLHDDAHEPRLVVSSLSLGLIEVDKMPRTRDLLNRLRMDIPDTASSSSRPVAVFVDSVISTTEYLDRV
jgi:hypothetical protein